MNTFLRNTCFVFSFIPVLEKECFAYMMNENPDDGFHYCLNIIFLYFNLKLTVHQIHVAINTDWQHFYNMQLVYVRYANIFVFIP